MDEDQPKGEKTTKKLLMLLLVVLMVSTAVSCSRQITPVPAELKLAAAVGDWAELPKRVTRILLEDELGYKVVLREAAADTAYTALAESELGRGSTFTITLPKNRVASL